MKEIAYDSMELETIQEDISEVISHILEVSEKMGFKNNLWQDYVAYLLVNTENAFSISCERRGLVEGSINRAAIHDFEIFRELYACDFEKMEQALDTKFLHLITNYENVKGHGKVFNQRIRDSICELSVQLAGCKDTEEFKQTLTEFYKNFGVGNFGLH